MLWQVFWLALAVRMLVILARDSGRLETRDPGTAREDDELRDQQVVRTVSMRAHQSRALRDRCPWINLEAAVWVEIAGVT